MSAPIILKVARDIDAPPEAVFDAWLRQWEEFWTVRLDALEALLKAEKEAEA